MKASLLCSFFISFCFNVLAQSHFTEGYIILTQGDTLKGYIYDNKNNWKVKAVQFTRSISDKPMNYPLSSFKSFYLKEYDEYYFSLTVEIDKKPIAMNDLENSPDWRMVMETILAKLVSGGKIDLYFYSDENSKKHFFVKKYGKTEELAFVKYFPPGRMIFELLFFKETLKSMTADCDEVVIKNPTYDEKSLKAIVDKYNMCFSEKKYVKRKEKPKLSGGVILGGTLSNFKYDGVDYASNTQDKGAASARFNSSLNGLGGVYLELLSAKKSNPFSAGIQVLYQQSGTYEGDSEKTFVSYRHYKIKYNYLTSGLSFKYFIVKKAIYIKAGLGYDKILSYDQSAVIINSLTNTSTPKKFMDFKSAGLNFHFGAGLSVGRAFAELRYQQDNFYAPGANGTIMGANLLVGYRIF